MASGSSGDTKSEPRVMSMQRLESRRLELLIEAGRALVSMLDLEAVLHRVLETARDVTGARYAALGILDERRESLERFLTLGIDEELRTRIGNLPTGRGVLGELIRDPRPLRVRDVGTHPAWYGFPPGHPPMHSFLGVPIVIRGEAYGNLYLTEKQDGEEFDQADEESAVILADWAAIAIENARLYRDAEARRGELEVAVRRLRAATEIMRALEGETDLGRVLELVVKRARALVDARWTAMLLVSGAELEIEEIAGEVDRTEVGTRVPIEGSISGQVLKSMRPERVADLASRMMVSQEELNLRAEAALLVPLVFRSHALGILIAANKAGGPEFTAEDARLLESFAASAATAVHTARSVAEDRLRHSLEASEQERKRWARELHDETLQALGGWQMLLSSALRSESEDRLRTVTRDVVEQVGIEIANLRSLILELRPPALDEIGLVPAIETLAQRIASNEGLIVQTNIALASEDSKRLAPDVESTLYRVVQEALTNVAKHAAATRLEIELFMKDDAVVVEVRDDGRGFDTAAPATGFGLVGIRERVTLADGEVTVVSGEANGTVVRVVIPSSRAFGGDLPLTQAG
jgi:two-component system, NarL family, sensor histidine kinase DevS